MAVDRIAAPRRSRGSERMSARLGWRRPAHRSQHRHTSRNKMRQMTSECPTQCLPVCRMTKPGTVAVRRQEQLGVSSEEHMTFHKASRWGYSRAATGRGAGRARCRLARARERAEKDSFNVNRLHQTCRPVNQYTHVEKRPLTTRHTARRSRDSCGMSDDRTPEL